MPTVITVPNDWDLEVRAAVSLAIAEAAPWFVTKAQRKQIEQQVMRRLAAVLPLGGGGPVQPTGGGAPVQPV